MTNEKKPFTNEDLAEIKQDLSLDEDWKSWDVHKIQSLLYRLETAECIVNNPCANECGSCYCKRNRDAWRKACGK